MATLYEYPPTHCPRCGVRWVGGNFLVGWDSTVEIPRRLYVCRSCDGAFYPSSR